MKFNTPIAITSLLIASALVTTGCSSNKPNGFTSNTVASSEAPMPSEAPMRSEASPLKTEQATESLTQNEPGMNSNDEIHMDDSEPDAGNPMLAALEGESEAELTAMDEPSDDLELEIPPLADVSEARPAQTEFRFGFDKNTLDDENTAIIEQHGDFLAQHPSLKITINGHADAQGDATYNEHLSLQRAKHVAELLKNKGVGEDQIEIFSWGANDPVPSANHHKENRRVEIIYADEFYVNVQ